MRKKLFIISAFFSAIVIMSAWTHKEIKSAPGCCYNIFQSQIADAAVTHQSCIDACDGNPTCIAGCNTLHVALLTQAGEEYQDCINRPHDPCWGE